MELQVPYSICPKVQKNGKNFSPMYDVCVDGFTDLSVQPLNEGIILVSDDDAEGLEIFMRSFTGNYKAESKPEKIKTDEFINNLFDQFNEKNKSEILSCSTKIGLADSATGLGGLVIFIGLYIGIIFLISSGIILALRSLSDSVDSIQRYTMLRKIGVDETDISESVFRQNLLFFLIPLIVAVIHSIFGMIFAMKYVLKIFGTEGMAKSVACSAIVILLIYGGYSMITFLCSKSIVKNKS